MLVRLKLGLKRYLPYRPIAKVSRDDGLTPAAQLLRDEARGRALVGLDAFEAADARLLDQPVVSAQEVADQILKLYNEQRGDFDPKMTKSGILSSTLTLTCPRVVFGRTRFRRPTGASAALAASLAAVVSRSMGGRSFVTGEDLHAIQMMKMLGRRP